MNYARIIDTEVFNCYSPNEFIKEDFFNDWIIRGYVANMVECDYCDEEEREEDDYECDHCESLGEVEEYREVLNHFFVSDWLARGLTEKGEYVAEVGAMNIWHNTAGGCLVRVLESILKDGD